MEESSRRFARRILLLHVLVLLAVLALVGLLARDVYFNARDEVLEQATARQELLADQTARGIESQYQAVLNNLDLFRRAEGEDATTQPGGGHGRASGPTHVRRRGLFRNAARTAAGAGCRN